TAAVAVGLARSDATSPARAAATGGARRAVVGAADARVGRAAGAGPTWAGAVDGAGGAVVAAADARRPRSVGVARGAATRPVGTAARLGDGVDLLGLRLGERVRGLLVGARRHLGFQQRSLTFRQGLRLRQVESERVLADRRLTLADVRSRRRQQ